MQKIIGITGGTGCGKTTALQALKNLGVHVIDCDGLYHQMLESSREMVHAIGESFPDAVENGSLQRKRLGKQVFGDEAALQLLNRTVWPFVVEETKKIVASHAPQPCAIDAIGLLESGLGELCTHTVAITAPEEIRVKRLMARDNISEDYARLRISAQKKNEVFAAACGLTIENTDSCAADFQSRCTAIFETLLKEDKTK